MWSGRPPSLLDRSALGLGPRLLLLPELHETRLDRHRRNPAYMGTVTLPPPARLIYPVSRPIVLIGLELAFTRVDHGSNFKRARTGFRRMREELR